MVFYAGNVGIMHTLSDRMILNFNVENVATESVFDLEP